MKSEGFLNSGIRKGKALGLLLALSSLLSLKARAETIVPVIVEGKLKASLISPQKGHAGHPHPTRYELEVSMEELRALGVWFGKELPLVVTHPLFAHEVAAESLTVRWPGGKETDGFLLGQLRASQLGFISAASPELQQQPQGPMLTGRFRSYVFLTELRKVITAESALTIIPGLYRAHPRASFEMGVPGAGSAVVDAQGRWAGLIMDPPNSRHHVLVPAKRIRTFARYLVANRTRPGPAGWAGLQTQPANAALRGAWHLQKPGLIVTRVIKDSPADRAGIKPGNVLTEFDGWKVPAYLDTPPRDLLDRIRCKRPGATVSLEKWRNGDSHRIEMMIGSAPPSFLTAERFKVERMGYEVAELTRDVRDLLLVNDETRGVLVSQVEEGTIASLDGLAAQDIVLEVNGVGTPSVASFRKAVSRGRYHVLLVQRRGLTRFYRMREYP